MGDHREDAFEAAFDAYAGRLASVMGHAGRVRALKDYCTGLLVAEGRKSVEPLAAVIRPDRVAAKHQSLLHFVGQGGWCDAALLAEVRAMVLPAVERHGPVEAWIIDDTSFPKKGLHSVGVARQYCGERGKNENCQTLVSLSVANEAASLPVAHRLFLPESWASDMERRRKAKVPEEIVFQAKTEIALGQMKTALAQNIPKGIVLADAGYGSGAEFRSGIMALGLTYALGIRPMLTVWRPGEAPQPRPRKSKRGPWRKGEGPAKHPHAPIQVQDLARELPVKAWQTIGWREGTNAALTGRFARLRINCAPGGGSVTADPGPEEWLLIEWPQGEEKPLRFWLSTLPPETSFTELVRLTKLRWRIERDFLDLKQECGLGHYEGRGWRGFHHHITLCIAAYGFLIAQTGTIPPSAGSRRPPRQDPRLSTGYRPRGAAAAPATPRAPLYREPAPEAGRRARQAADAMSML
jgi:SRSO17 transposase